MYFAPKNLEGCVRGADGTVFDFINSAISVTCDYYAFSTIATGAGTDTSATECTDTCPIDVDAIGRNLAKEAESVKKQLIESITGNAE